MVALVEKYSREAYTPQKRTAQNSRSPQNSYPRNFLQPKNRGPQYRAICLLCLVVGTCAAEAETSQLSEIKMTLSLPEVIFMQEDYIPAVITIQNDSDKHYAYFREASRMFLYRLRLHTGNVEGNTLGGAGGHVNATFGDRTWREGHDPSVLPGASVSKEYTLLPTILSPESPGEGIVRLQEWDHIMKEFVSYDEVGVKVRNIKDCEREVLAENRNICIERVTPAGESPQLVVITKREDGGIQNIRHLLQMSADCSFELEIDSDFIVHVVANSPTGKSYYTKRPDMLAPAEVTVFDDGKVRSLKKAESGTVTLEISVQD